MKNYNVELVKFDKFFLDMSYEWLSDLEIKRLTKSPNISREDQIKWFDSLEYMSDYIIRGVKVNGVAIGVVGLKHIDYLQHSAEYFGYIGEKAYWGKGIGTNMIGQIEKMAIHVDINFIFLKVAIFNKRAISLYKKCGYSIYDKRDDLLLMKKTLTSLTFM